MENEWVPLSAKTRLNNVTAVREYLDQGSCRSSLHYSAIKDVVPLQGGVNYTFRVFFEAPLTCGRTAILKYAEGKVASTPHILFGLDRQICELQALIELPGLMKTSPQTVKLPHILYQDLDNSVLIMEDVTPPSGERLDEGEHPHSLMLKEACKPGNPYHQDLLLAEEVGSGLGCYMIQLHGLKPPFHGVKSKNFPLENMGSRIVCAQQAFGEFLQSIEGFGVLLAPERRDRIQSVMLNMTERVLLGKESLIMGDFWVGNIIATLLHSGSNANCSLQSLFVLDWEFFTHGAKFVDLGHFAAEAWLYDHFYPAAEGSLTFSRQLTSALFQSYRAAGGSVELQPIIYYMAGHIGCFLSYTKWTEDPDIRKSTALLAVGMIENALREDWSKIVEDDFLAILLD